MAQLRMHSLAWWKVSGKLGSPPEGVQADLMVRATSVSSAAEEFAQKFTEDVLVTSVSRVPS